MFLFVNSYKSYIISIYIYIYIYIIYILSYFSLTPRTNLRVYKDTTLTSLSKSYNLQNISYVNISENETAK